VGKRIVEIKEAIKIKAPSATPRARARNRSKITRAKLVDAAIEEFWLNGFHETKVSDIVARAGISQPAFYMYFRSKDAIYAFLVKRVHDELLSIVNATVIPPDLSRQAMMDGVRATIEAFLQYFVDNPHLSSIGYFQDTSGTIRDAVVSLVSRKVAFEQGTGYWRKDVDPLFFAECYGGTIERVIRGYLLTGKSSAADLAIRVSELFLHGMLRSEAK
jgi:TetR/AcrR family fatty acid metabolism transcriptional regulator